MEQNMTTIPFDLETAKRIVNGEQEGSIVTAGKKFKVELVYHIDRGVYQNLGVIHTDHGIVSDWFSSNGHGAKNYRLELEVPEYLTFRDGDVIYCEVDNGGGDYCKWISVLDGTVGTILSLNFHAYVTLITDASKDAGAVLFDDSSDNIGLIRLATEQEKQKLIDALKASKVPRAKEYLKRFFGIKEKSKYDFKPFDKVLVKNDENEEWNISLFAREIMNYSDGLTYEYECCNGILWNYCIPFEGNEHLLADKIVTD